MGWRVVALIYACVYTCDILGYSNFFCGYFFHFHLFLQKYLTVVGEISLLIFFFQTFRCLFFISMYMCVCVCACECNCRVAYCNVGVVHCGCGCGRRGKKGGMGGMGKI